MKKQLPLGVSDFRQIIKEDFYYFDKTDLIENLYEENSKVKLFTRPRRFGKTLNMSMLKYFFDVEEKDKNRKLFEGLKISKSKYFKNQGQHPVIFISFRNYSEKDWESGFDMIKNEVHKLYNDFKFIRSKLDEFDLMNFDSILLKKENSDWKNSIFNLSKFLYDYYGKKEVIILIDEYDQPILDSYTKGYYSDAINFFKTFYGNALKDNKYLKLAVMTGILRVAKENIFSGLNNLHVKSIMNTSFSEYFGVTENEVEKALKDYDLEYEQKEVQDWYNGYLFGNTKIYNPWSIVNFLSEGALTPYWVNSSENSIIKEYLQKCKREIFEDFEKLLRKETILKKINETLIFENYENNYYKNIWNLFFHSGYLTFVDGKKDEEGRYNLKIPNREILEMFVDAFVNIYFEDSEYYLDAVKALRTGDMETFERKLKEVLLENTGRHNNRSENY